MELGKYKKEKIDFSRLTVSRPKLNFYNKFYKAFGCGPSAASCLSGLKPEKISLLNHDKPHFSDETMVKFLESQKFKVVPITAADLTNSPYVENNITTSHLLLLSQMYSKNQASWVIVLGLEYLIHNFEIQKLLGDEFIQRPILTSYILFKKSWR